MTILLVQRLFATYLVSVEQLKKETNQEPANVGLKARGGELTVSQETVIAPEEKPLIKAITRGNILSSDENLEKRKEMISAKGFEPAEFAFERAIGRNDSLYSNFTELIALTKRKIGRIVVKEDNKRTGYATGFMVSDRLLLTNWHVFRDASLAVESEVHFFYEYNALGHPLLPVIFKFDPTQFFNNEDLDYCFVAVQPFDVTGKVSLESIGYLFLDRGLGKIGEVNVEKLNIIHHPQGDYKQISIRENLFVDVDETKIYYETDTAQGSSGSPVFNDQWQVVGLHHKSIAKMSADGKNYLDKDDQIIPIIDNKIDVTRVVWLKNEGMRISVVLNHLLEKNRNSEIVNAIAVPPRQENLNFAVNPSDAAFENNGANNMNNSKNININIPTSALSNESSIEISLSSKKLNAQNNAATSPAISSPAAGRMDELLLEVAKAEREQAVDFSKCRGYDPDFLGTNIPLPQPKAEISNQIARLKNNKIELKYANQ